MTPVDWREVLATDFGVPAHPPLADLTAELTDLLGATDTELRDELAVPVLRAWISRGVYDDLLVGLGDGIATGLTTGLGRRSDDSVFRRTRTANVLGACVARDTARPVLPGGRVLDWADRIATWMLSEKDLRSHESGKGWIRAIGYGADALDVIAGSPHCGRAELAVLLDLLGERVTAPVLATWTSNEADRLAAAALAIMRRDQLSLDHLELWVATIGDRAFGIRPGSGEPDPVASNVDGFVRALYLQLALAPRPPRVRADLLLTVVAVLRELHPDLLDETGRITARR